MQVIAALQDDVQRGLARGWSRPPGGPTQTADVPPTTDWTRRPTVVLVVGVNGSGKTTTIAAGDFLGSRGKWFCWCRQASGPRPEQQGVGRSPGVDVVSGSGRDRGPLPSMPSRPAGNGRDPDRYGRPYRPVQLDGEPRRSRWWARRWARTLAVWLVLTHHGRMSCRNAGFK
jgi:hypothetical protein